MLGLGPPELGEKSIPVVSSHLVCGFQSWQPELRQPLRRICNSLTRATIRVEQVTSQCRWRLPGTPSFQGDCPEVALRLGSASESSILCLSRWYSSLKKIKKEMKKPGLIRYSKDKVMVIQSQTVFQKKKSGIGRQNRERTRGTLLWLCSSKRPPHGSGKGLCFWLDNGSSDLPLTFVMCALGTKHRSKWKEHKMSAI